MNILKEVGRAGVRGVVTFKNDPVASFIISLNGIVLYFRNV